MSPERFDALRGDREAALHTILAETTADVARRAAAGTRRGPIRGFVGLPGILRRPWGPGWALVGDAGYYKDAITSHGISDALRDAELLARGLDPVLTGQVSEAGALSDYERVRDDLSIPLFDATARIASYDRDLTQLKRLHRALSTEMQRETRFLRSLDAVPLAGAGASR
jgi:flavin-dependent dehydrogenase